MDFSYLLDLAKQNEKHAQTVGQVKRYSTQVSLSKKEPRSGLQSDAIKKFLATKEKEDKEKKLEDKKKKEKLLQLRAQDRKSNARVQAMLSRTKAANKAVLDDVKKSTNTAVTSQGLDIQPDDDDYGYVSKEASELYKNLVKKYSTESSVDPFGKQRGRDSKELRNTKNRVKNVLHQIEDDESSGRRKQRKSESTSGTTLTSTAKTFSGVTSIAKTFSKEDKNEDFREKKRLDKNHPKTRLPEATLSFDQILQLAAKKQHEPVKLDKVSTQLEKKESSSERLMTVKEREDLLRRKREEQDRISRKQKLQAVAESSSNKKIKIVQASPSKASTSKECGPSSSNKLASKALNNPLSNKVNLSHLNLSHPSSAKSPIVQRSSQITGIRPAKPEQTSKKIASGEIKKPLPSLKPNMVPSEKGKTLATAGKDSFPRHFNNAARVNKPGGPQYRMESDEEEYDSELDDFIDDGPDEANDYSKHIREIFGYDKSRYRRIESDEEDCMESNFAQQMKEEIISTKLGIMEDLEQERLLKEEESRKKKMMKKFRSKK